MFRRQAAGVKPAAKQPVLLKASAAIVAMTTRQACVGLSAAKTITERADAVVRGMTDNRSNAFVEAMNGLLLQAKRAARGFRTASNFIAIAYLRMPKLKHLPAHPFALAAPK